jgi:hypothetical protein
MDIPRNMVAPRVLATCAPRMALRSRVAAIRTLSCCSLTIEFFFFLFFTSLVFDGEVVNGTGPMLTAIALLKKEDGDNIGLVRPPSLTNLTILGGEDGGEMTTVIVLMLLLFFGEVFVSGETFVKGLRVLEMYQHPPMLRNKIERII